MIGTIQNILHEIFRFEGLLIKLVPNEMKNQIENGDFFDILCNGNHIATFDLAQMVDAFCGSPISRDEVIAEIIDTLVTIIEREL